MIKDFLKAEREEKCCEVCTKHCYKADCPRAKIEYKGKCEGVCTHPCHQAQTPPEGEASASHKIKHPNSITEQGWEEKFDKELSWLGDIEGTDQTVYVKSLVHGYLDTERAKLLDEVEEIWKKAKTTHKTLDCMFWSDLFEQDLARLKAGNYK